MTIEKLPKFDADDLNNTDKIELVRSAINSAIDAINSATATLAAQPQNNFAGDGAPDADNDETEGYSVGSVWVDITNDASYTCADASEGAAVWLETGTSA